MWCHMEKLPQRPAIIDSPQRCTQLGTFTNKGRPINISHADRARDRESDGVGEREGMRKIKRGNSVASCFVHLSFTSLVLLYSHLPPTVRFTKSRDLLFVHVGRWLQSVIFCSHSSLITVINGPSLLGWSDRPLSDQLSLPPHVLSSHTHTSAGEVIHDTLTKAARTSSV